ncbi:GDSL-type esterase/lipase family protein [Brevibacillus sp. H7]|uniref:GDSL-type esterase/lipase family protein n=1 Tax=Brevibacillus sp. H7 TaxID=3349138 RepID=UPI0037FDE2D4
MKKGLSLSLASLLVVLALVPLTAVAKVDEKVDYLALGDSLAAGQTPYREIGKGYTDFLAEYMDDIEYLDDYSNAFAVPGYTTGDVLRDIEQDVAKGGQHIQASIEDAEIITLDAGANDILREIKITPNGVSVDREKVEELIEQAGDNLSDIFSAINDLNPDAEVFVMGYYNSFPYLPEPVQKQLMPLLDSLNHTIKTKTLRARATFVPTAEAIAADFRTYLPNPADIHPSEEGYEVLAHTMWKEVNSVFPLASLQADKRRVTLEKGKNIQLTLTATYKNGEDQDVTSFAQWSTTNKRIVEVKDGKLTAKAKGTAAIKARYGGKTYTITVKVK